MKFLRWSHQCILWVILHKSMTLYGLIRGIPPSQQYCYQTGRADTQMTHLSVKLEKMCYTHTHTSHKKHTVLDLFNVCSNYVPSELQMDKNLNKNNNWSLWFWHTCDLKIRSSSSNLVWIASTQTRLLLCKVWKTSLKQCPSKSQH